MRLPRHGRGPEPPTARRQLPDLAHMPNASDLLSFLRNEVGAAESNPNSRFPQLAGRKPARLAAPVLQTPEPFLVQAGGRLLDE